MDIESAYYRYMGFDGDHARRVRAHYVQFFASAGRVLELGSGQGEFLDVLRQSGIDGAGVDSDEGMVAAARSRGHEVVLDEAGSYLDGLEPGSFGGVFCAHMIEHLEVRAAAQLIERVTRALAPDGVFVAVLPNPACYAVLTADFWRDPTHVRFYDPSLVAFLCELAGLEVVATEANPLDHPGPPPGTEADLAIHPFVDPVPDDEQGELAHLKRALRITQIRLRELEEAHRTMVWTLYQPNEVYVVAVRRSGPS